MILIFEDKSSPKSLEKCWTGSESLCSFDVSYKSSNKNSVLLPCRFNIHMRKLPGQDIAQLDLKNFRSTLKLNENDRLYYIDNDNDELPIDHQTEFLEALKFAQAFCNEEKKYVPLIIVREKNPKKLAMRSTTLLDKSRDNMTVGKNSTPSTNTTTPSSATTPDNSKNDEALVWFREFLESYKREIVADVTKEVLKVMTSAMLQSQQLDSTEGSLSDPAFPGSAKTSAQMTKDPASRAKIHTLYNMREFPEAFQEPLPRSPYVPPVYVPREAAAKPPTCVSNEAGGLYPCLMPGVPPPIPPPAAFLIPEAPCCSTVTADGPPKPYMPIPMRKPTPQQEQRVPPKKDKSGDGKNVKILEGPSYNITVVGKNDRENEEKLEDWVKKFKEFQKTELNVDFKEAEAAHQENNDDNDDANGKPLQSNSDNISILSDNSHMSEFLMDDETDLLLPEEGAKPIKQEMRRESSSSFELISENLTTLEIHEEASSPSKKNEKPMIFVHLGENGAGGAPAQDNSPNPEYGVDTQGKIYKKNVSDASEEMTIEPELDKRSGGTYSYVAYNLPDPRENISGTDQPRNAKKPEKNIEITKINDKTSDEDDHSYATKKSAPRATESNPPRESRDGSQPRRRVFVDHNVTKGLGDTKRTPKKEQTTVPGVEYYTFPPFTQNNCSGSHHAHPGPYRYGAHYHSANGVFNGNHSGYAGGDYEQWCDWYRSHVPPHVNQQWQSTYTYTPDAMQILPETLISSAVHAASSAYTTARKVIEKIRSPQPGAPDGSKPRKV